MAVKMLELLKIAGAIFETTQNGVMPIRPLERAPSIYLEYEKISKSSKSKLDGFSIEGPYNVTINYFTKWDVIIVLSIMW